VDALGQACDNMDTHFFITVLREVDTAREEGRKVKERWSVYIRVEAHDDAEDAAGTMLWLSYVNGKFNARASNEAVADYVTPEE
jgi:hypothetical protein